jgi:hypothetical protein
VRPLVRASAIPSRVLVRFGDRVLFRELGGRRAKKRSCNWKALAGDKIIRISLKKCARLDAGNKDWDDFGCD